MWILRNAFKCVSSTIIELRGLIIDYLAQMEAVLYPPICLYFIIVAYYIKYECLIILIINYHRAAVGYGNTAWRHFV